MEISNLVHLFKLNNIKEKFLVLLLLSSFSSNAVESFVDQAVFRLSGQVYFLSDIKKKQTALKSLNCADSELFLSKVFDIDLKKILDTQWMPSKLDSSNLETDLFPYIILEKLKLNSLSSGKDKLSLTELHDLGKKCTSLDWKSLTIDQKAIFLTEVYLRDRFKTRTNTQENLQEFKNNLSKKEKHEIMELKLSEGMEKTLNTFLKEKPSKPLKKDNDGL